MAAAAKKTAQVDRRRAQRRGKASAAVKSERRHVKRRGDGGEIQKKREVPQPVCPAADILRESPPQRCEKAQLPQQNHPITAAFGRSNARDLIKRIEIAVAAFPSHASKPQTVAKARRRAKPGRLIKNMLWLRRKFGHLALLLLCGSLLSAAPPQDVSTENSLDRIQAGKWVIASMYWQDKVTATGAAFKPVGLHAAHKTLPIGTLIRVSNPKNHRSINITINDRGPYIAGRELDLTLGAGALLGFEGLGPLYMEVLALPGGEKPERPLVENLYAGSDAKPIELPEALKAMASAAEAERVEKAKATEKEKAEKAKKSEKVAKADDDDKCRKGAKCRKH